MRGAFLVALTAVGVSACKESGSGPNPPPPAVASVTLSATSATLEINGNTTLVATPRDASGTALSGRTVSWNSDKPAVATVSNGLVTAVSEGLATITATSEGKSATALVTVNAATLSCASNVPTGRLTHSPTEDLWNYESSGGWQVTVAGWAVTVRTPDGHSKVEFWGDREEGSQQVAMAHANMNGKHVKDIHGNRQSVLLPDGLLLTLDGTVSAPGTAQVSIYDVDQTHRLQNRTSSAGATTVMWSCAHGQFGETNEADGETSRFFADSEGWFWELIYRQDMVGGVPGPKVPGVQPLSRSYFANPNNVTDYYDDPRLEHT
ncbi:MAG TPA: Ig-like domain-containing protein [Gemmatimonadales bacterium]|nr:Ig-like domain-containing protein [Gemmatimonadales bacterium]